MKLFHHLKKLLLKKSKKTALYGKKNTSVIISQNESVCSENDKKDRLLHEILENLKKPLTYNLFLYLYDDRKTVVG